MKQNIILTIIVLILSFSIDASSQTTTQNNTSGSNTSITGGYSSTTTSTYESGSASNSTTTNNSTTNAYSGDTRVAATSTAPSMSAYSQDLCVVGYSGGVSTFGLGVSGGSYTTDQNCERIKLSKVLNDLGMKVAAVSILCQDARVFYAMEQSGTPCPFEGKIGSDATAQWLKYDKLRPDYNQYVDKLKIMEDTEKQKIVEKKKTEELKEWYEAKDTNSSGLPFILLLLGLLAL
jgi:hypothetical protein